MKVIPYEPFKRIQPPPKPPVIKFADLVSGRDRLMWAYFGLREEYHVILDWLKSSVPLSVTIAKTKEEFENSGNDWLDKKEFKTSISKPHCIDEYLSGIDFSSIKPTPIKKHGIGLIIKSGFGCELTNTQFKKAEEFIRKNGLKPVVSNILSDEVGAVAGVECSCLWKAARDGLPVAMPDKSIGFDLAKRLVNVFAIK